jgi:hypothetical protein
MRTLQFRISGDGRYGVSLRESGFRVYRQLYKTTWQWEPIASSGVRLAPNTPHSVRIDATGAQFVVTVDGVRNIVTDDWIRVGQLGLYAHRSAGSSAQVTFAGIFATTDPTARSNFSLLHSTPGYAAAGSKRALVRTVNRLDPGLNLTARWRIAGSRPPAVCLLTGTSWTDGRIRRVAFRNAQRGRPPRAVRLGPELSTSTGYFNSHVCICALAGGRVS